MQLIWNIKMHQLKNGQYRVIIINGEGCRSVGMGPRPRDAYRYAEMKLVIKPNCIWLE